jgi:uncharacterized protein YecT (DUF1311 family)
MKAFLSFAVVCGLGLTVALACTTSPSFAQGGITETAKRDTTAPQSSQPSSWQTEQDAQLAACTDAASGTSLSYSECNGAAIARADARLNLRWKDLLTHIGRTSEAGKSLIVEQRAWIAFKDKACMFYWGNSYGSMHRSIIGPTCLYTLYQNRIEEIETYIENTSEPI